MNQYNNLTFSGIILYNIIPRRKEVTMEWWQWVLWGLILIVAFAIAIAAMTMAPPLSYILFGVAILFFVVDWVVLINPPLPSPTPISPSPPIPTSSAGWDVQEPAATPTPSEYPACYWVFSQVNPMAFSDAVGNYIHPEWGDVLTPCEAGEAGPDGPTFPPYCWCGGP